MAVVRACTAIDIASNIAGSLKGTETWHSALIVPMATVSSWLNTLVNRRTPTRSALERPKVIRHVARTPSRVSVTQWWCWSGDDVMSPTALSNARSRRRSRRNAWGSTPSGRSAFSTCSHTTRLAICRPGRLTAQLRSACRSANSAESQGGSRWTEKAVFDERKPAGEFICSMSPTSARQPIPGFRFQAASLAGPDDDRQQFPA